MRKILTLLLLFYFTVDFSQSLLVGLIADKNINKKILTYKNENGSTLVYLPTVHTGKKEYFDSIKKVVDSLRKENYMIAYEGIIMNSDSADYELNSKKLRKVLGFHVGNMNQSKESLPDFYNKKDYIIQNNILLGIDTQKDVVFDVTLDDLIKNYEKAHGEIQLNEYDLKTALNEKYEMRKNKKGCVYCMTQGYRDDFVVKKVSENKEKNMVLLFGKAHKFILHANFLDHGYKLVSGKL
ncbi:hypothetical protein LNP04_01485 [Chryseobacterium sp. C-71]|uniref:hypothetical protein n=1 Tax=Chryseobacterium sp. C-71 TaxID=2893882 RepID=UPI001E49747D|nr:hypothetical protein [Chryseobacterium sp. C-71]UFH32407.1 hypothetical protein LNP04_01485 [Chryseobacterium sp. C-71]